MENIKKYIQMIEIKPTFYVVFILSMFFDVFNLFFYGVIFVTIHEMGHIVVAKRYGLKIKKISITPIGQIAHIEDIEKSPLYKRLNIVMSGIAINLILGMAFYMLTNDENMQLIGKINLSIAFFNCLPIFPLDGARVFLYILGSNIGDLKASLILKKISYAFSFIIFGLGFLQVILYPYNISLLCLGFYFVKINKTEYIYQFYKVIVNKQNYEKNKILKIKHILLDKDFLIKDIVLILSVDYYIIINVAIEGKVYFTIDEKIFLYYIQTYGINGKIYDVYKNYYENIKTEEEDDR